MTKYFIHESIIGLSSEIPPAENPTGGASDIATALYIESDTGAIKLSTGQAWQTIGQFPLGTVLPNVTSDGLSPGGLLAPRYSSVPLVPNPTGAVPILTAVSAASQGLTPLPAATYNYVFAWEDSDGNSSLVSSIASVTVSSTQIVQLDAPTPHATSYVSYYRYVGGVPLNAVRGASAGSPSYDNALDGDFNPTRDVAPQFNQTYPISHFGPTVIAGPMSAFLGVSEFNTAPLATQPTVTASRADAQAQIDALYAILATKGALIDSRTA